MTDSWACSRCGRQAAILAIVKDELVCIDCSGEREAMESYQEAWDAFLHGERDPPLMSEFMEP